MPWNTVNEELNIFSSCDLNAESILWLIQHHDNYAISQPAIPNKDHVHC